MQTEIVPSIVSDLHQAIAEAERLAHQAVSFAGAAINAAIAAGELFRKARKDVGRGDWQLWVESNCPMISYSTATRWMKLSEIKERDGIDVECASSVRQAYILAGLLPEPEGGSGKSESAACNYLVHVSRLERALRTQLQSAPLASWAASDRDALRDRLRPLVEIYNRLAPPGQGVSLAPPPPPGV
jgi:hypothetical protein